MTFLQLKGVEKQFGDVKTIKGIDLSIDRGQFTVFVGPSGCGKSTLLRLIAGLETLSAGSINLDGRDITRLPSAQRDLAMVFQSYALYPHMTVAENMSFSLRLAKADPSVIKKKVDRAEMPEGTAKAGAAFVGIRPEALRVTAPGEGQIAAEVELIEALGAETLIYLHTPRGAQIVSRQNSRTTLVAGDKVGVDVELSHLHWFDAGGRLIPA